MADWYVGSVQHAAIAQWQPEHTYAVGDIVRSPDGTAENARRCLIATVAGTSSATEPSWIDILYLGDPVTDGTVTWEHVTGSEAHGWATAAPFIRTVRHDVDSSLEGDRFFVASDHDAVAAVYDPSFYPAAGMVFVSVDPTGSVPPTSADLLAGATETTSVGTGIEYAVHTYGKSVLWGLVFKTADKVGAEWSKITINASDSVFENCEFHWGISPSDIADTANWLSLEGTFQDIRLKPATADCIIEARNTLWRDSMTPFIGDVFPSTIFKWGADSILDGVDLSGLPAGTVISYGDYNLRLMNCVLPESYEIVCETERAVSIEISGSAAGDASRYERWSLAGKLSTDFAVMCGDGANDGLSAYSWLLAPQEPGYGGAFQPPPLVIWNDVVGASRTATIELLCDGVTLTETDIWLELSYLADSAVPRSQCISSTDMPLLHAPVDLPASDAAWVSPGVTTPIKQKLEVSFTAQMAGVVRATLRIGATASGKSFWIDPKIRLA